MRCCDCRHWIKDPRMPTWGDCVIASPTKYGQSPPARFSLACAEDVTTLAWLSTRDTHYCSLFAARVDAA